MTNLLERNKEVVGRRTMVDMARIISHEDRMSRIFNGMSKKESEEKFYNEFYSKYMK